MKIKAEAAPGWLLDVLEDARGLSLRTKATVEFPFNRLICVVDSFEGGEATAVFYDSEWNVTSKHQRTTDGWSFEQEGHKRSVGPKDWTADEQGASNRSEKYRELCHAVKVRKRKIMSGEYYVCNLGDEHSGWMDGCMVWWRPEGHGYTYDLNFAGIFTEEDKAKRYPDPKGSRYIPREVVDVNSYSPRIAWWSAKKNDQVAPLCEAFAGLTGTVNSESPDSKKREGGAK